jgi:hypothetical protein
MREIEKKVLDFVALATAANVNMPEHVDLSLIAAKTQVHGNQGRIIMGAAPWVKRMWAIQEHAQNAQVNAAHSTPKI